MRPPGTVPARAAVDARPAVGARARKAIARA